MRTQNVNRIVMKRGWEMIKENPSIDDIIKYIYIIESDEGHAGPPDITLEYQSREKTTAKLLFLLTFDIRKPPLWLIHYIIPQAADSKCLVNPICDSNTYVVRTCCGLVQHFREDCLFEQDQIPRDAIRWFLEHGGTSPSLTWMQYDIAVQDI